MNHLHYSMVEAAIVYNEYRHPQVVIKEFGITYQHATPQSISDSWWFWNCENIPDNLPSYLTEKDWNPISMIGWGLSEEEAISILRYKHP